MPPADAPQRRSRAAVQVESPEPAARIRRVRTVTAPSADSTPTAPARRIRSVVDRSTELATDEHVEIHVEPVVVAEPLLAGDSAADPVELDAPAIDLDATAETIDALVADVPAHTVLDDVQVETAPQGDAFEEAARAFSFTGEVGIVAPATTGGDIAPTAHVAPRRHRGIAKRLAAASVSLGALAMAGLLTVGLTTPAQALASATSSSTPALAGDVAGAAAGDVQAYVVPSTAADAQLNRTESYTTGTMVDLAGTVGIIHYSDQYFTNNVNCPIQWPFATGTTISYGFGWRDGEFHEGVDFTPGEGAHIQAVADGVVSTSTDSGGGYGVTIVIDIVVDGQPWSIRYGHMEYGSRQVQVGDHVKVGEFIGQTGDTGYSFGAHTHVEVLQNGTTPIDPMPWFQKYATC